jgi:hypothetical protein
MRGDLGLDDAVAKELSIDETERATFLIEG